MVKSLRVMLWGEEIGRLTWDERRKSSYFTYNPEYVKRGIDIAPLVAPIGSARSRMPIWGEEAKIYQRLPSFVAINIKQLLKLVVIIQNTSITRGNLSKKDRFPRVIGMLKINFLFSYTELFKDAV